MKISVIICTKNRVQELVNCIKSVVDQSVSPDEIVIVDASDTDKAYLKIKEEFHQDSRLKYIHSTGTSGLSADTRCADRNRGIRNSFGDIILFLDDDTMLDKDFIKKIMEVFEKDFEKKIGGVMGQIIGSERPKSFKNTFHHIFARIFLLSTFGNGEFRASGSPTFIHGYPKIREVEFLSGCCMAYRKEVFKDVKFDEDFPELYIDDEDFSRRVSLKYRNVYTPYAKLIHTLSPIGSTSARLASQYTRSRTNVKSRYYLLKKNFPHTLKHTLAFWWSVVGLLLQAILTVKKEKVKGVINGVSDIKRFAASS
jgi:GT2 family glycosyltransferase